MLEILEAGTGHGGLTIHLARAIHAANPPRPEEKDRVSFVKDDKNPLLLPHSSTIIGRVGVDTHEPPSPAVAEDQNTPITGGESQLHRHAIIHTLDISSRNSKQARKLIGEFRRGLYANDVEFHANEVSTWIDEQTVLRGKKNQEITEKPFLSHIILDLPNVHHHLEKAASVLYVDGRLLVFCPSITQIITCFKEIRNKRLPLELDQVLEVGDGIAGGREWDVRFVQVKARLRDEQKRKDVNPVEPDASTADRMQTILDIDEKDSVTETRDEEAAAAIVKDEKGWEMVCRPKIKAVGTGGGFVGLWRKMR